MDNLVTLDSYHPKDRESFFSLVSNEKVMKFVDGPLSKDFAYKLFESFLKKNVQVWSVKLQDNTYIGHAAILQTENSKVGEILFYLFPEFWGKGLATCVGKAIITKTKKHPVIDTLEATLDSDHIASQKVCKKIGMRFVGVEEDEQGSFMKYKITIRL